MNTAPVTVLGSEMRMVESKQTGRTYRITISLPHGYSAAPGEAWPFNRIPAKWPAVYLLDANFYFGMVTDMIRPVALCGAMSDAIVVGIGYAEDANPIEAFRDYFTRRNIDLTPVREEAEERAMEAHHKRPTPSGDAANFHRFIKDELIPLIEQEYRADPSKRILAGHSYGGLFGLVALLETPDLFDTWIIGSPTLSYGNRYTFQREEVYAKEHKSLPAKVFLYAAELEEAIDDTTLSDTLRFAAILQARKYTGLSLIKRIFPEQNHCEVVVPGFHAGLKFALKK